MKYLIALLILLLLSVWFGSEITQDTGYVLIVYRHWSVETTLWATVISLIILFVFLYIIFRLLGHITRISKNLKWWREMYRYHQGHRLTAKGLCALAEGRWQRAERILIEASKITKSPFINYLGAAEAANSQKAYERRDNYLQTACITTRGSDVAVGLTQVKLQINSNQWGKALATLEYLNQANAHHAYTLKLLKQVYLELKDWQNLRGLLPSLRKYKVEPPVILDAFEQNIYINLLVEAHHVGKQSLLKTWNSFPRRFHQDPELINTYTHFLVRYDEANKAISLIESVLKKHWNADLVTTYGLIHGEKESKQLAMAEGWFKKYQKEPELLLCLGRLSLKEKFLRKAHDFLQSSIKLSPSAAAYQELGRVYEAQGQNNAALDCYRKALEFKLCRIYSVSL